MYRRQGGKDGRQTSTSVGRQTGMEGVRKARKEGRRGSVITYLEG